MPLTLSEVIKKMSSECVHLNVDNKNVKEIVSMIFGKPYTPSEDMTNMYIIGANNLKFNMENGKIDEKLHNKLKDLLLEYAIQKIDDKEYKEIEIEDNEIDIDLEKNMFICNILIKNEMFLMKYRCFIKFYSFYDVNLRTEYACSNVMYMNLMCVKINSLSEAFDFIVDNKDIFLKSLQDV